MILVHFFPGSGYLMKLYFKQFYQNNLCDQMYKIGKREKQFNVFTVHPGVQRFF